MSDQIRTPQAPRRAAPRRADRKVWPIVALIVGAVVLGVALPFIPPFSGLADLLMPGQTTRNTQQPVVTATPTPTLTPEASPEASLVPSTAVSATPVPVASSVPSATPAAVVAWVKTDGSTVTMRKTFSAFETPAPEATAIASVPNSTMVTVLDWPEGAGKVWVKVKLANGTEGFIRSDFLSKVAP